MDSQATGRTEPAGNPCGPDRVVQAAARLVLEPIFEADFRECSYGFRPKRSAHQARERIRRAVQAEQCRWVVDADIEGFFDHIDHDILLRLLRRRLSDRRMLHLISGWLKTGVLEGTMLLHPQAGTSQGGVVSPLLANVYLHSLDEKWERRYSRLGKLVRYADDLVILTWQAWQADKALKILGDSLGHLGLKLSASKTSVVQLAHEGEGFDFLGYHFRRVPAAQNPHRHFCACWPSQKAMQAARDRVRDLTPCTRWGFPSIRW